MNNKCHIVEDLIPLVLDGAATPESREFVETHIAECESCKALYESARGNEIPAVEMKDRRNLQKIKKRLRAVFICLLIVCIAVCSMLLSGLNHSVSYAALWNLYFMPLLGVAGTVLFRKRWFFTPVIVYLFTCITMVTIFGFQYDVVGLIFLNPFVVICTVASLIGCFIGVLLRVALQKKQEREKRRRTDVIQRILAGAGAALLCCGMFAIANAVVGNPISLAVNAHRVQKYLDLVYPGTTIESVDYDFLYGSGYIFRYTIDGENLWVTYNRDGMHDGRLIEFFDKDAKKRAYELLRSYDAIDPYRSSISITTERKTDKDASGDDSELPYIQSAELFLVNPDMTIREDEGRETAARLSAELIAAFGERYHIRSANVTYLDKNGGYTIFLNEEAPTYESLLEHTAKISDAEMKERFYSYLKLFAKWDKEASES